MQEPTAKELRVNLKIRVPRVLVIDEVGHKLGEFMTEDAVRLAQERGFDLVEVAPEARPPVCRITDFGKLKYEKKKKASAARRNQVLVQLKEVKIRPKTDDHDMRVKVGHTRRFLEEGNKVKITVRFRGREFAHREIGTEQCLVVADAVKDLCVIESSPRMEGRQMFMILAPTRKPQPKRPRPAREDRPDGEEIPEDEDLLDDDSEELDEDDDSEELDEDEFSEEYDEDDADEEAPVG